VVATVHDGDTITLAGGTHIRLFGIDAPELAQQCKLDTTCVPCGLYAREELKRLVLGKRVTCRPTAISYDRVVARCRVGKVDVDLAMIAAGQAIAYRKYLEDEDLAVYVETEDEAREEKRGIWGMSFVPPAEWRHNNARLECERR
jgi:endonuclease YncB( thermonuclease family)